MLLNNCITVTMLYLHGSDKPSYCTSHSAHHSKRNLFLVNCVSFEHMIQRYFHCLVLHLSTLESLPLYKDKIIMNSSSSICSSSNSSCNISNINNHHLDRYHHFGYINHCRELKTVNSPGIHHSIHNLCLGREH